MYNQKYIYIYMYIHGLYICEHVYMYIYPCEKMTLLTDLLFPSLRKIPIPEENRSTVHHTVRGIVNEIAPVDHLLRYNWKT